MLEMLYQWIRDIAFYLVIVTAILEMLPGESYKKYVRFFSGMVLILLLISPLLELVGIKADFAEIFHSREYEQEKRMLETQGQYFEDIDFLDFLPQEYKQETEDKNKTGVGEIRIGGEMEGSSGTVQGE